MSAATGAAPVGFGGGLGGLIGGIGGGLGGLIGGALAHDDTEQAQSRVDDLGKQFQASSGPYNTFGQSFLNPASGMANRIAGVAGTDPNLNYNTFMSNYETSPAAKYEMGVADAAQNNSAAARGDLLSGSNLRQLGTVNTGIADMYANKAYGSYLQGNQQQFGQLESALGNMFQAIGVGTTSTGQQAGVDASQMGANANLAATQSKNDASKGSGIGSMFGAFGKAAF